MIPIANRVEDQCHGMAIFGRIRRGRGAWQCGRALFGNSSRRLCGNLCGPHLPRFLCRAVSNGLSHRNDRSFRRTVADQNGHTFRGYLDSDPSNACFVLNPMAVSTEQDSFVRTHGFFSWALQEHAVALELERSPDGGYGVRLHLSPKGLAGTGAIWGGAVGAVAPDSPPVPPDIVSAVRMGEPDIAKCPPLSDENR